MILRLASALVFLAGAAAAQTIEWAFYDGPTDRYPHGVLGDEIEYTTLVVRLNDGRQVSATWTEDIVFEDIAPRLADINGDGAPEVITVESHQDRGARLAVWGLRDGSLMPLAALPFIGTRFRWLAPVAWEDLDGDGLVELAYIDRPHLAKTLRVWRIKQIEKNEIRFDEVATQTGLSNHQIGWSYISGGTRDCGDGPEMVLATGDWTRIVAIRLTGDELVTRDLAPYSEGGLARLATRCD